LKVLNRPNSDVLDIGSGIGVYPVAMSRLGHRVTSVDISTDNAQFMEDRGVRVLASDLLTERLPFDDQSFDVVSMFDVIEHFHGSPRHALSEIFRILRPGGAIIVETPNIANLRRRLVLLSGRNPMSVKYFYETDYPYSGHVYEYTLSDLESTIRWSSFELIESRHQNSAFKFHKTANGFAPGLKIQGPRDVAMFGFLAACKLVPSFRDTIVCIGRRPLE
jgi:SAM-dependent methyltransferase